MLDISLPAVPAATDPITQRAWLDHELLLADRIGPIQQAIVQIVKDTRPDLMRYPALVFDYSLAQSKVIQLETFLMRYDPFSDETMERIASDGTKLRASDKRIERAMEYLDRFMRLSDTLRDKLGLAPLSEAEVVKARADATTATVSVEDLMRNGLQARGIVDLT